MTERVEQSINLILEWINGGQLMEGACVACVIGRLYSGLEFESGRHEHYDFGLLIWGNIPISVREKRIKPEIFTFKELSIIETAFEKNTKIEYSHYRLYSKSEIIRDQIKGLEAVVKVMLEFDDCKDEVKEVFTNKAELIAI